MAINLSANPTSGEQPLFVQIQFDWIFDPSLCVQSGEWVIDWGDGYTTIRPDLSGCSGSATDSHWYGLAGQYIIKVYAVWIDYDYNTYNEVSNPVTITVLPPPPPPAPAPPPLPPSPPPIEPPVGPPVERPLEPEKPEPPITPEPPKPIPPDHPPSGRMSIDAHIWNKFIARFGDRITRWGLEVPLDEGDVHALDVPEQYRAMWQRLTQHKADAVIEFNRVIYVCEIKPRLTLAALGQAYFGWQLFIQRYRVGKPCKPAVICETAPTGLLQIAAQNGITVFVVEEITPTGGVKEWIE